MRIDSHFDAIFASAKQIRKRRKAEVLLTIKSVSYSFSYFLAVDEVFRRSLSCHSSLTCLAPVNKAFLRLQTIRIGNLSSASFLITSRDEVKRHFGAGFLCFVEVQKGAEFVLPTRGQVYHLFPKIELHRFTSGDPDLYQSTLHSQFDGLLLKSEEEDRKHATSI